MEKVTLGYDVFLLAVINDKIEISAINPIAGMGTLVDVVKCCNKPFIKKNE